MFSSFLKKYLKKIIIIGIILTASITGVLFQKQIQQKFEKYYTVITEYFHKKPVIIQQDEKEIVNHIEIINAVSLPHTEKLLTSGVTYRETIKYVTDNFHEIEFIVPRNITKVKKGQLLIKYKTTDLELRAERLRKDVEIKNRILERGNRLDEHSVISKDELDKLKIEVNNASGELKEIEYKIAESTKKAPFDCQVKHHGFINGSHVPHGQDILTIFRSDKILVDINANLKDITALDERDLLGKSVKLYFPDKRTCKGKVIYFLNNADPYTASLPATIEVDDEEGNITSGEICDVKIYTGILKRHFLVPEEAICGEEHDYHVFIIRENIAYKTPIIKHGKKGEKLFITGINEGDVIATSGAHKLTNLCKVRI